MHSKTVERPFSLALRLTFFYQPVHDTGFYRLHLVYAAFG